MAKASWLLRHYKVHVYLFYSIIFFILRLQDSSNYVSARRNHMRKTSSNLIFKYHAEHCLSEAINVTIFNLLSIHDIRYFTTQLQLNCNCNVGGGEMCQATKAIWQLQSKELCRW